jgi:hypothetical protein
MLQSESVALEPARREKYLGSVTPASATTKSSSAEPTLSASRFGDGGSSAASRRGDGGGAESRP